MNDDSADVFTEPCRYGPVGKSKKFRASGSFCYYLRSLIINVVGNCIGVFGLHAGVAGVAWPSLISRTFSAVVITVFCFSSKNPVRYLKEWIFRLDGRLQKTILRIAVPTGVESGISAILLAAADKLRCKPMAPFFPVPVQAARCQVLDNIFHKLFFKISSIVRARIRIFIDNSYI